MVPTTWAVLAAMPLTSPGKTYRKVVTAWVDSMSEATFRTVSQLVTAVQNGDRDNDRDGAAYPECLAASPQSFNRPDWRRQFVPESRMRLSFYHASHISPTHGKNQYHRPRRPSQQNSSATCWLRKGDWVSSVLCCTFGDSRDSISRSFLFRNSSLPLFPKRQTSATRASCFG